MTCRNAVVAAGVILFAAAALPLNPGHAQIKYNLLRCWMQHKGGALYPSGPPTQIWLNNTRSEAFRRGTRIKVRMIWEWKSSGKPYVFEKIYTLKEDLKAGRKVKLGSTLLLNRNYKGCTAWPMSPTTRSPR